jgi:hypothetical protein
MHHNICLDCGGMFATADRDVALCPACFRAYIAQNEGEGPARVFDADYADGYADAWYTLPEGERRRLLTCEWPEGEGR